MPRKLVLVIAAAALVAGCDSATPRPTPTPTATAGHDEVRIVNLNAAMGYKNGAGDAAGTDALTSDYELLADDILNQRGDVANLQEMALPASRELRTILEEKTGDTWELNFSFSGNATYYTGQKGESGPRPDYRDVPAGNAQLIRIGDGITRQKPLTDDGKKDDGKTPDQGIMLPSVGRSFVGAELTVPGGTVAVYNTHLALADQVADEVRAGDVLKIQEITEADTVPSVLTGDFNQTIDFVPGQPYPSPKTVDAIRAFMDTYGYADVGRDKGPTSNEKRKFLGTKRIDYILARGIRTTDTVRFVSHESDHWGLATTIAFDGIPSSDVPPPTPLPTTGTTTSQAPTTTTTAPAGPTTEGAITRYQQYLHAVGAADVATMCEIAGPAAKRAEDEGFGPCEQTMPVALSMFSPEQRTALLDATVDPAKVAGGGTTVRIPAAAVRAAVTFTSSDLGDAVMSYLDGEWFVTD
ncbi:endonuclease/exonuclease/phosphatase family protein [Actinophytocola algeriensis]|uniref:Endonuclease/exonuclease/phosphatase family metal-dependent hydrolase n=1 Tax=Actinophytocola algeriensis TaxID=1768010 RepID=A0A7W7QBR1_9PSEU|nr:endonuclease/exonuclease/phosphatase family protein [Actinophytocola algeriensis]MBB4910627.1 endonuclease/exonuclease/phosphatase family metal-dependent hydrolase [Actinophytocola algeriensis]MBE1480385.1 endonuclease/exonuclease/phosphatase family metal-dependent hydrolase [Actinophytocola algeriensis]